MKNPNKRGRHRDQHAQPSYMQQPAHTRAKSREIHRESPKIFLRRPLITMRGPTLGSLDGEVELLEQRYVLCDMSF